MARNKGRWAVAIGGGILALGILIGGAIWGFIATEKGGLVVEKGFKLPTSTVPRHYAVRLQPFLRGNYSILGHLEVEVLAVEGAANITLHVADITVLEESVKITSTASRSTWTPSHIEYDLSRDFLVLHLSEDLLEGRVYILSMDFEGYLNDQLRGFYRSSYTNEEGEEIMIAGSFFAPTHARRAFPCFDEPALKATFEISIARSTNMSAISNMPLARTEAIPDQEGWEWDHFNTTVPMSTYLVAFVISDFKHNSVDAGDVVFSVWARAAALEQADYALQTGPKALNFFESYFDIPYPLPKQDMVAFPDFAPGAMENWGLIIYRETAMLFEPGISSASNLQQVATVVVHELAHQWFGNLVTPKWWTDVWLNEGFATYMEFLGTDFVEPSWQMNEQFVVSELHSVFGIDSLESSHPISVPVESQDQLNEIYDVIAYVKGASILRMMNYFLGEPTFRKGISNYLKAFEYEAAEQDDLWDYLTQAAHGDVTLDKSISVKDIMDTWTLQMGFPVVKLARSSDGKTAKVTQQKFTQNKVRSTTSDYSWWVPLTFATQDDPDFNQTRPLDATRWMTPDDPEVSLDSLPEKDSWIIVNVQQTGYYRVNYDDENWELISKQLKDDHEIIHVVNRAQVMDDALTLASAGQLSYAIALGLNEYLSQETEFVPWAAAMNNLDYIDSMMSSTSGYGALKHYLLSLLVPLYDSVGFEDDLGDAHLDQYKRVLALRWTCGLGYVDCVDNAVEQFGDWIHNGSSVSPNLKSTVYCSAIGAGGEEEWEEAWHQYLEANVASEKSTLLSALGCTKEIWILSRYLDLAFTEGSGIRKQDASSVFSAVASNSVGRHLAWNFLRDQWGRISTYYDTFASLGSLVTSATAKFNTRLEKQELELFIETNSESLASSSRAVAQALESTENNIAWMDSNYEVIVEWLQENGYGQ